jgi:hypothetical protein
MRYQIIKIKVSRQKFDEIFSIDDWFNFEKLTNAEMYQYMLNFVVDDKDEPVSIEDARNLFKTVKVEDWVDYIADFATAIREAFVSPTNGGS